MYVASFTLRGAKYSRPRTKKKNPKSFVFLHPNFFTKIPSEIYGKPWGLGEGDPYLPGINKAKVRSLKDHPYLS